MSVAAYGSGRGALSLPQPREHALAAANIVALLRLEAAAAPTAQTKSVGHLIWGICPTVVHTLLPTLSLKRGSMLKFKGKIKCFQNAPNGGLNLMRTIN
jgi:hypothetical protein